MRLSSLFQTSLAIVAIFPLIGFLCSCSDESKSRTEAPPPRIAVIPKGTTYEFWNMVRMGAMVAGEEDMVELIWDGPVKEDHLDTQIDIVQRYIDSGVSGIILAPQSADGLVEPVKRAEEAGIPVVIIDSDLNSNAFISFISTENHESGRMAGQFMATTLGNGSRVALIRFPVSGGSTQHREDGFLEGISEAPEIKVVSSDHLGGVTPESAYTAGMDLLELLRVSDSDPGVDGIFCPNESTTAGMLRALQDSGLAGEVKLVGFDSSPALVQGLKDKEITALIVQNPYKMGYLAVKTMKNHLEGKAVKPRIDTGAHLVTPENMDSPELKKLLY